MTAGAAAPAASSSGDFAVGEKVFVPHPDRHYEAKILKVGRS
jgi:mortality factor 4-like protein 1